jgi:hypothetical protein
MVDTKNNLVEETTAVGLFIVLFSIMYMYNILDALNAVLVA